MPKTKTKRNKPIESTLTSIALHAISVDDAEVLNASFTAGLLPHAPIDDMDNGLLHHAAIYGAKRCIAYLLDAGLDPDARNRHHYNPAAHAFASGQDELAFNFLMAAPSLLTTQPTDAPSLMCEIARRGQVDWMRQALDKDAMIDQRNPHGMSPLAIAFEHGHWDMADLLIERGAQPNLADYSGTPPALWAMRRFPNYLIGCDPAANLRIDCDSDEVTLEKAERASATTARLFAAGANPDALFEGAPLLFHRLNPFVWHALVQAGANLSATSAKGITLAESLGQNSRIPSQHLLFLMELGYSPASKDLSRMIAAMRKNDHNLNPVDFDIVGQWHLCATEREILTATAQSSNHAPSLRI